MELPGEAEIVRSPSPELLRELSLVLQSVGIPFRREQGPGYQSLLVAPELADRALDELARYQRENRNWPPGRARASAPKSGGTIGVLIYAVLLVTVFRFEWVHAFGLDWKAIGRSEGASILAGEWWRPMTALSLHADLNHLAGNLVLGGAIGLLLSAVYGPGLAWLCILISGTAGNLINSAVRGFDNASIGASTAVFAALGALAAAQWFEKLRLGHGSLARFAPFLAAASLLAWYGMGGAHVEPGRGVVTDPTSNVDIGAHVFGFIAGIGFGALLAWWQARGEASERARWTADAAAFSLMPLAWLLAILAS